MFCVQLLGPKNNSSVMDLSIMRKGEVSEGTEEVEKVFNTAGIDHAIDELNLPRYDDKETIKLLRKVDRRLLPILRSYT